MPFLAEVLSYSGTGRTGLLEPMIHFSLMALSGPSKSGCGESRQVKNKAVT